MKNFKIIDKTTEKEYWISRSVAIAVILYYIDAKGDFYVLLERRGKGCPDFVGYWCLPCGYVDWDETLEEAARREVYEETGLNLTKNDEIKFVSIQDNPKDNARQNITIRFSVKLTPDVIINALASGEMNTDTKSRGGELNEVESFKWVEVKDVKKYNTAWNHDQVIKDWYEHFYIRQQ